MTRIIDSHLVSLSIDDNFVVDYNLTDGECSRFWPINESKVAAFSLTVEESCSRGSERTLAIVNIWLIMYIDVDPDKIIEMFRCVFTQYENCLYVLTGVIIDGHTWRGPTHRQAVLRCIEISIYDHI